MALKIVILAAGKGTRMVAHLPKVLHPLGGIPLLGHVIHTANRLTPAEIIVIYSPENSQVREALADEKITWVEQKEQLGTGHAVMQALPHLAADDQVLILYSDVPLITHETLDYLITSTPTSAVGILVAKVEDPSGLGRIIRNADGKIVRVVEHNDANQSQRRIKEINTGIVCMSAQFLQEWLPQLGNDNQQGEYYLTDMVAKAVKLQHPIHGVAAFSAHEIQGVNNRWQLARLERYYQELMAKKYSLRGVAIKDFRRFDVRGRDVEIGKDVEVDINVVLAGKVRIGSHSYIGPNVVIENSVIGEGARIEANAVIRGAIVEDQVLVGPFAHLREGTYLSTRVRIGNFVEIKNAHIGPETTAKHLAYIGDAKIGARVNIGAGMITCNYDGANKWETVIRDGAFVGANATLVAPIEIGAGATVAAGSTLTDSAPPEALSIARPRQSIVKDWKKKRPVAEESVTDSVDT